MGKIVAVSYLTLDGVFENPTWSGPYFNEELSGWQAANLEEADVQLLGRKTYEGFADAWPTMEEQTGDFGRKMNGMPKWVATTTLTEPRWNARFLQGDVAEAVAALKAGPDGILINGSGELVNHLTRHNLIDEYRMMLFPFVAGEGARYWSPGTRVALALTDAWRTKTGVEVLTYQPA